MKIVNSEALHDYSILDRFEAGIKLTGPEVKSIKLGHISLKGSFVKIFGNEIFLINASVPQYKFARVERYDPGRTRKLLLKKTQIISLIGKMSQGNSTLVPLSIYTQNNLIKVEVGLARGKKQFEKRAVIKKREEKRNLERGFRGKVK